MNKGMHNHNTSNAELFLNPSMAIRGPGHTKLFEARTCESHMSNVKGKGGVFAAKGYDHCGYGADLLLHRFHFSLMLFDVAIKSHVDECHGDASCIRFNPADLRSTKSGLGFCAQSSIWLYQLSLSSQEGIDTPPI